jgi:hypothetical protein
VIDNDFGAGCQRLVARIYVDGFSQYLPDKAGDYRWTNDWHSDGDCPFKEKDELHMKAPGIPIA